MIAKTLFEKHNIHFLGLAAVRKHMLSLASTRGSYDATYFSNIVWAVPNDAIHHFNMMVPCKNLLRL